MTNRLARIPRSLLYPPQQASHEYRRLALDLAKLVVGWERRRQELAAAAAAGQQQLPAAGVGHKRPREDGGGSAGGAAQEGQAGAGENGGAAAPPSKALKTEGAGGPGEAAGEGQAAAAADGAAQPAAAPGSGNTSPGVTTDVAMSDTAAANEMSRSVSYTSLRTAQQQPAAAGAGGGQQPPAPQPPQPTVASFDESFKPSPLMEESVVTFLVRFVLIAPEGIKEDEAGLQQGYGLQVLLQALKLWPHVSCRVWGPGS